MREEEVLGGRKKKKRMGDPHTNSIRAKDSLKNSCCHSGGRVGDLKEPRIPGVQQRGK